MADYVLFVDESGDFSPKDEKPLEKKIVGGVFLRYDIAKFESELGSEFDGSMLSLVRDLATIIKSTSSEAWFQRLVRAVKTYGDNRHDLWGLASEHPTWKALHWAPLVNPWFAGQSFDRLLNNPSLFDEHKVGVRRLFEAILDAVIVRTSDAHFVAAFRGEHADHFSMPVARYRSMLLDVIATAIGAIAERLSIDSLSVVISQNSYYHFESAEESVNERSSLQAMVESGLTSMGLYNSASRAKPLILVAQNHQHPLLRIADFACGLARQEEDSDFGSLYEKYASGRNPRLRVFNTVGNLEQRRARVLERDGDLTGALIQWMLLARKGSGSDLLESQTQISRLTQFLRAGTYAFGAMHSMEELVQRLDLLRGRLESIHLYDLLALVEAAHSEVIETAGSDAKPALLFRLRSYMLVHANHLGNRAEMHRLREALSESELGVIKDPSNFASILRYQVAQTDSELNELNFAQASKIASDHFELIELYEGEWPKSFVPGREIYEPEDNPTSLWIRAKWNLWRCELLAAPWVGPEEQPSNFLGYSEGHWRKGLTSMGDGGPYSADDLSRLLGLRILASCRVGTWDAIVRDGLPEVRDFMQKRLQELSEYDIANACRGETLGLLWDASELDAKRLFLNSPAAGNYVNASLSSGSIEAHPLELICRDIGLARYLLGAKEERYTKLFSLANKFLSGRTHHSAVFAWLYALQCAVQAFAKGESFGSKECVGWLTAQAVDEDVILKCSKMWDTAFTWKLQNIGSSKPAHQLMRLLMISPY